MLYTLIVMVLMLGDNPETDWHVESTVPGISAELCSALGDVSVNQLYVRYVGGEIANGTVVCVPPPPAKPGQNI